MIIHLTLDIDDAELLEFLAPLRVTRPPTPAAREPGEDPPEPEHLKPAAGSVRPTGKTIWKWAVDRKRLPEVVKRAKALGIHGKLTQMSDDQARELWAEICKGKPVAANGQQFGGER